MNRISYLQKAEPIEIKTIWEKAGSLIVNNETLIYTHDTIFQVDPKIFFELDEEGNKVYVDSELQGAFLYCNFDYIVNEDKPPINWLDVTLGTIENTISLYQGVSMPHFTVLLLKEDWKKIKDEPILENYVPYNGNTIEPTVIQIPEDEMEIILSEVSVPFIRLDELEYSWDILCNICIKPALQEYYKFFPIIEDYVYGNLGNNSSFKILLPPFAYNAVAYYTIGAGAAGGTSPLSPFAYMAQEIMGGGVPAGGGTFGRGLSYRKPVPGFTGTTQGMRNAVMDQLAANQGYLNQYRREYVKRIKEKGKMYITGYSTIGGALNIKWLKWSPDWDLVDFEDLPQVRQLCTAFVLRNLGMLRGLIKSDIPGQIDFEKYLTRADKLDEDVHKLWNTSSTSLKLTPTRGGLS
jgi:hypothetical protein